jgi:hypothetical protein
VNCLWIQPCVYTGLFSTLFIINSLSAHAADTGLASSQMYNRPTQTTSEIAETIHRVRIPVFLQGFNEVGVAQTDGRIKPARVAGKPISHVLRARIEKPNDFYLGDWRLQSTPIRWLKQSNYYQVKIDVFRRYGGMGQVEENLGSMYLTGSLKKQADGLYSLSGSANRRFQDSEGHPILTIQVGTPTTESDRPTAVSRAPSPASR